MYEILVGSQHHQISVRLLLLRRHLSIIHASVLIFCFPDVLRGPILSSPYRQYLMLCHSANRFLGLISNKPEALIPKGSRIHAVPRVNGFPKNRYLCLQLPGNQGRMGENTAAMVAYQSQPAALRRMPRTTAALGDSQQNTLRLAKVLYICLGQVQLACGQQWGTLDLPL